MPVPGNERVIPIDRYIKDNLIGGSINGKIKEMSKHAPNLEFEIKWKNSPDRLYPRKAKEIARERIAYMERFFESLKDEINSPE